MLFRYPISFLCVSLFLVSCAGTAPHKEYTLALTALTAAKKFEANKDRPIIYRKALVLYQKGEKSFNKRLYGQAQDYFERSMKAAEKSENFTRWTRYQKGDYSL